MRQITQMFLEHESPTLMTDKNKTSIEEKQVNYSTDELFK